MRLKNYDYSQNGLYFITICTKNRENLLGNLIIAKGGSRPRPYIDLNWIGIIVQNELLNIENHFNYVKIKKFIIMPNHIHFIIQINTTAVGAGLDPPSKSKNNLSQIIGLYKSGVSKKIHKISYKFNTIWQRNYYEHIIKTKEEYLKICKYIENNPKRLYLKWR